MQQRNDQAHQLPDPPAPAPPPQPGETLTAAPPQAETGAGPFAIGDLVAGRFRVLREIAEGGMGIVYLAEDERLHQRRALKCAKSGYGMHLPPEARSALRVTHPNVCRIFEMHTTETPRGIVDFLAMEYIDGLTLASRLRTHGPPAPQEALAIALQICAGLQAAHDGSLLHRDLKSNNVLLAKDRAGALRAVVMDFGLAQEQPAAGKQLLPADASGTPGYIAPERYHGARASVASDIYALGVVLHELATGRRPAGIKEEPETSAARPDPALRGRWKKVVRRCLQNDPAKRYASAREVASALSGNRTRRQAGLAAAAVALLAVALWTTRPAVTPPARLALFPLEARASNGPTQSLVRGASYDLSNRLARLRPRPPQLVVIPLEDTRGILTPEQARARLGATHALLGTVTPQNGRLALRGSVIDTATKVALREVAVDFDQNDAGGLAASMAALVAAAFRLPRQTAPETVAAPAYRDYAEGMSLLRSGTRNFDKAAAALHRAVQLDPRSSLPRAALAEAFYNGWLATGELPWLSRGREQLAEAIRLNPDSVAVHLAAGKLNLAPGSCERAAREFQRAIELDPASAEGWRGLALSYEGMPERGNEAVAAYLKAIEVQPGYSAPLTDLGIFFRQRGNYAEAEKYWRRVTLMTPQSIAAHTNLGGLYTDMGRWEDAEKELKLALQLDAGSRAVLNNLGALALYRGRDAEAAHYFQQARAVGPETDVLMINLGDAFRRTGRANDAAAAYRRGRALAEQRLLNNPRDAVARAFLAYFLLRLGGRQLALSELAQALALDPQNKSVLRRAVLTYEAMGERPRALAVLQGAPADVVKELSRQPDLAQLRQDPRFAALMPKLESQRE